MVTLKRITQAEDEAFRKLTALYTEAFPVEERREIGQLGELLHTEPAMYFNAVECDGQLAGLFVYWDFGSFYYLEHLAVFAEMRNKKIGQQILDWVKEQLQGVRLLEVEPAETEMATRRIHYYERNGYRILDRNYLQPPYVKGGKDFPLWVMGNGSGQSAEVLPVLPCVGVAVNPEQPHRASGVVPQHHRVAADQHRVSHALYRNGLLQAVVLQIGFGLRTRIRSVLLGDNVLEHK